MASEVSAVNVEIWTPDESAQYTVEPVQGLRFSHALGLGYATCTFSLRRDPRIWYDDLTLTNVVKIATDTVRWSGEITTVGLRDTQIDVDCQGPAYRLESRRTTASFGLTTKASSWITTNIIGDADLGFTAGNVATTDYQFPLGIDLGDSSTYMEAVEKFQKANNWIFKVEDGKVYWYPKPTTPEYLVKVEETEIDMARALEGVENYLRVEWTDALEATSYFWWPATGPDATSEALYRRRDGYLQIPGHSTEAQAQQMATIVLNERKVLRPQTSLTAVEVRSLPDYTPIPKEELQSGELVTIEGLYIADVGIDSAQALNELTTFEVALVEYEKDTDTVTLSPGTIGLSTEKVLARAQSRETT